MMSEGVEYGVAVEEDCRPEYLIPGNIIRVLNTPQTDNVNHPEHYKQFDKEVIDIIRFTLGDEKFKAYCQGCELKYRLRLGFKGDAGEDTAKAMKYNQFRSDVK